jgi:hypothetical protein
MTVKMTMLFWVLAVCRVVGRYQHFREMYCHHLRAEVLRSGEFYIGSEDGKLGANGPIRVEELGGIVPLDLQAGCWVGGLGVREEIGPFEDQQEDEKEVW